MVVFIVLLVMAVFFGVQFHKTIKFVALLLAYLLCKTVEWTLRLGFWLLAVWILYRCDHLK